MWKEFREFISRGSVIDLAIGIVIGAAFGSVINSFVYDILMPPIGMLLGGVNFQDLFLSLNGQAYPSLAAAKAAGAPTINYGLFINTFINFLIVAFALFLVVRVVNRMRRQPTPAAPTEKNCPFCKTNIPIQANRCPNCTSQLS